MADVVRRTASDVARRGGTATFTFSARVEGQTVWREAISHRPMDELVVDVYAIPSCSVDPLFACCEEFSSCRECAAAAHVRAGGDQ